MHWQRSSAGFAYEEYNRDHEWVFEGGIRVAASAATQFLGTAGRVDPEEAFVASVASCHMLTFLAICARKRLVVDRYADRAIGYLEKNDAGRLAVIRVELSPKIVFGGEAPADDVIDRIHHQSHRECFIANSIRTEVVVLASSPAPGAR
ncbi:MAG: OsmC family protein [Xanthomonadales bacterium]|nr:OsmC family protein [Xanthomonadales bacterium]